MYDPESGENFAMNTTDKFWWEYNNSLPILVSAVNQGSKAGVYFWPGSSVCQMSNKK